MADADRKKTVCAIEGSRRFIDQVRGAQFDCRRMRNAQGVDNEMIDRFDDELKNMEAHVKAIRDKLMQNLEHDEKREADS
jgi:hypothetical protein